MKTLTVNLADRSYPIHVGENLLEHVGEFLHTTGLRGKVAVVTNPTVAQLYLDGVQEALSASGFDVVLFSCSTVKSIKISNRLQRSTMD